MIKTKEMVRTVLEDLPATRDDDILLTIEIWRRFFPEKVQRGEGEVASFVYLKDLHGLPREDHVKRMRAYFQAAGRYLPTKIEVVKARRLNEEKWHEYMGELGGGVSR